MNCTFYWNCFLLELQVLFIGTVHMNRIFYWKYNFYWNCFLLSRFVPFIGTA